MHPIRDYFLIGDLHTAALVSKTGSIEWLCLPQFDSLSLFGAILDDQKGGRFSVEGEWQTKAAYLPGAPVVETHFTGADGDFTLRDFMLPRPSEEVVHHYLIRRLQGGATASTVRFAFDPRPDYGRSGGHAEIAKGHCAVRVGDRVLSLHLPRGVTAETRDEGGATVTVPLEPGQALDLVLEFAVTPRAWLQERDWQGETLHFWSQWLAEGDMQLRGKYIERSAITLKLMQFYPSGALVAAPTTSLPEQIGGGRNWDYRFTWMRDATFTLYALMELGFVDESKRFLRFVERIAEDWGRVPDSKEHLDFALMYTIWGQPLHGESTLDHLAGYADSRPVRVGNGAAEQFQLDVYGVLIDSYYVSWRRGLPLSPRGSAIVRGIIDTVKRRWTEPDSGIWEVRGPPRHFTYSKVMAWVAVDRALRMSEVLRIDEVTKADWEALRTEIHDWIWAHCYNEEKGHFRQHPETEAQDASTFLFVPLQFLDREDPRTMTAMRAAMKELMPKRPFVYRYLNDDGLEGGEGAFILCSYWLVCALAATGAAGEAATLFQELEALIPPESGLLAEEVDEKTGAYLGNFPQAFSHLGYVMAAAFLKHYGADATPVEW